VDEQNSHKEPTSSFTLSKTKKFSGLLRDLLFQEVSEHFFQEILNLMIREIAKAQAGSLMVLHDGRYHFVAATGYDLKELQHITLSLEESILFSQPCQDSYVLSNFQTFNEAELDQEREAIFLSAGKVTAIQETLLIPVRQQGQTVAMVYLDNFERANVFTPYEIETAEELGVIFGLGIKFQSYQKQLSEYQDSQKIQEPLETVVVLETPLCPREKDVLRCITEGMTDKQIASKFKIAPTTIRKYASSLYRKLGVGSRTGAALWAKENGHILK
jgi:DNA-binding CsgD family transcriptional regulator